MQTLKECVSGDMEVEEVGHLPEGGVKVRISGVRAITLEQIEKWRAELQRDGWVETGVLDMDEETLVFVCRRRKHNLWMWAFLALIPLLVWRVYLKI